METTIWGLGFRIEKRTLDHCLILQRSTWSWLQRMAWLLAPRCRDTINSNSNNNNSKRRKKKIIIPIAHR